MVKSFKQVACAVVLLLPLAFASSARAADEPTLQQVYAAAEAGRFNDAQAMMDKVLQAHPNSAKAHFVEAELLAKQGRIANARTELNAAENFAPGLPFAKPEAVQKLRERLAGRIGTATQADMRPATASSGISWTGLLLGGGVIGALIYFARAMMSRRAMPVYAGNTGGPGYGPNGAANYGPTNGPMGSTSGAGMGSGILGGLATGAAVGAGMVAGEALAHRFMDGNRREDPSLLRPENNVDVPDDMGGNDFGINDSSSWDDSSGGGGDDNW